MGLEGVPVLVTGAGGFIGSHLADRLVDLDASVKCLVHYNGAGTWGWLDASPNVGEMEVVMGDIADPECVERAMKGVDVVFHLAALIGIPYSYVAPHSYVRTNVDGTLNVLQSARALGTGRIVHTSTSEVYGSPNQVPIPESHSLQGQSPYSATKIAADKLAESFHLSFGVPVTTVRPFNTYGPRQSARAVIPTIITQYLSGVESIQLGNLKPTRDLTFVSDTVEGFVAAATAELAVGEVLNLGTGNEISIGDLAYLIRDIIGSDVGISSDDSRARTAASEVVRLCSDNSKAERLLGWTPTVELGEGLSLTVEWIKDHLDRYRPHIYAI
jgi:dTDP-glucose 4,6-dehydratase